MDSIEQKSCDLVARELMIGYHTLHYFSFSLNSTLRILPEIVAINALARAYNKIQLG